MRTFRELYCEHHQLPPEQFQNTVVFRCLHWPAKLLWWLLKLNPNYLAADFEFVRSAGELRSRREFRDEVADFHSHPANLKPTRRWLHLRVSAKALQSLFEAEIAPSVKKARAESHFRATSR